MLKNPKEPEGEGHVTVRTPAQAHLTSRCPPRGAVTRTGRFPGRVGGAPLRGPSRLRAPHQRWAARGSPGTLQRSSTMLATFPPFSLCLLSLHRLSVSYVGLKPASRV